MIDQGWLKNLSVEITKSRELSEVASKNDLETAPYESKYKARKIIKDLISDLEEQVNLDDIKTANEADEEVTQSSEFAMANSWPLSPARLLAALEYDLGMNYIETEESSTGEDHLKNCLKYLDAKNPKNPLVVSLLVAVKCQHGILWSSRADHEKALGFLKEAEQYYEDYVRDVGNSPLSVRDILLCVDERVAKSEQDRKYEFEKQHTLTLYFMAQTFSNLGQPEKSARYCHITLLRQKETSQYEPADWALNCATLSQYYITKDMYTFARYCLACASEVANEAETKFNPEAYDEVELQRARDKVDKMKADVARCWAKYCLNLLISSHTKMLELADNAREGRTEQPEATSEEAEENDLKHLKFKDLEVTSLEEEVNDKHAKDYEDAKKLFLSGQKWLQSAKEFYIFDGYVTDFIEISQDMSQFFKYLAIFDNSFDRRCKMQKRRIDILTEPLRELSPQHFLQVCRQLTFEIGEIYGDMADLKKAIMEQDTSRVSVDSIKKFNKMLLQGIHFYQSFIDSYKQKDSLPKAYEDDAVRGVLLAFFYMARLYSKYLTPDRDIKADYMKKEMSMFEYIVNYCDAHPDMPKVFEEELEVSREMLALFPAKMNKFLDS